MRFSTVRVVGLSVSAAPAVGGAAPDKGPSFRKALVAPRQAGRPAGTQHTPAPPPPRCPRGRSAPPRGLRRSQELIGEVVSYTCSCESGNESRKGGKKACIYRPKKKKKGCKQKGKGKHTKCQFEVSRAYVLNILNYFYSHVFGRIIS